MDEDSVDEDSITTVQYDKIQQYIIEKRNEKRMSEELPDPELYRQMFELQREEAQKELDEAHENIQYLIELLDSNNQEKARRRINFKPKKKKEAPKKKKEAPKKKKEAPKKKKEAPKKKKEVPKKKKDKSKKKKDKSNKKKDKSNKK